jgi:integrase/recombinase XerC
VTTSLSQAREAWRDWLRSERRLSGHTLTAYEHDIAEFVAFMTKYLGAPPTLAQLGKLKPAEFRAWLADRAHQGLARTSTARAFSSVRSFFRFLDKRDLAHNASIAAIQTPKLPRSVPKALSERDMAELLEPPPSTTTGRDGWIEQRDTAILLLLYGAGLRIGEALGLAKATIDSLLDRGQDTLDITGKGNKTRLVPLLPAALEALAAYRDACPFMKARGPRDAFFLGARGNPLDPAIVQKRVRRFGDAACAAPLLRHPPAGGRRRPAHHPGAAGARQPVDHPALHRRRRRPPERGLPGGASASEGARLARSCFSSNRPWRESTESTGVHSGVDRLDADDTRVSGQESTNSATPRPLKNHLIEGPGLKCRCHRDFRPSSDSRRSTIIIMRAILHDHAPNTYYGH